MTPTNDDDRITMVHCDLTSAPVVALSANLQLHWYQAGDEDEWVAIHEVADQYNCISRQLFVDQFADDVLDLPERQCYLIDDAGTYVATATAWAESRGRFAGFGRVHWVAVRPAYQRRGIGTMLVSIICRQLVALGHRRAFLTTSTLRPNAIRLYEKFGFKVARDKTASGSADNQ